MSKSNVYKTLGQLAKPEIEPTRQSIPSRGHSGTGPSISPPTNIDDVLYFTSQEHKINTITNNRIVVVDVYADWCGPCKMISPQILELAKKYNRPGQCIVCKEDAELELSPEVTGLPTFLFYIDGKKVGEQIVGADVKSVEERIIGHLSSLS
jgi:thioredoxin 1